MTAATLLAREGCDVTVLEQHQVPGGLMHTFQRAFRQLPTGVHNVGCLDPGEILWRYLTYLDVFRRIRLRRMPDDCVVDLQFPQLSFRMPGNRDAYRQRLVEMFPDEQPAIDAFLDEMRDCGSHFPLYNCRYGRDDAMPRSLMISVNQRLEQLRVSPQLHAVLTGHSLLWGVESAHCPLYIHHLVTDTLLRGACRIGDDGPSLGDAFAGALQDAGGSLRCNHEVTEITCEDRHVRGVTANGEFFPADVVVFTGHPRALPALCTPGAFRQSYRTRLADLQDTLGSFGAAVQWDCPECPASEHDVFLHEDLDTDRPYLQRLFNTDQQPRCIYLSGHPHPKTQGHTVTMLTPMYAEEVQQWAGLKRARRGDEYEQRKADVAARMIRSLERRWPQTAGKLKILAAFTPLTLEHYTRSPRGSAYGVKRTSGSLLASHVGPVTRVQGLLLAGQNIVLSGVIGAVISGVQAAQIAVGDAPLVEKIAEKTGIHARD